MNTLKVTVDKSHIVTIGEKLYGESVELIRELVNNAYDADATEAASGSLESVNLQRSRLPKRSKLILRKMISMPELFSIKKHGKLLKNHGNCH